MVDEEETWVDIEGCSISNFGRVKLPKRGVTFGWDRNGYLAVNIKGKKEYVHRLVALCFCEGYKEGLVVDHIDSNKTNNNHRNLRWVTLSENSVYKPSTKPKITDKDVMLMLEYKAAGKNNVEISHILETDRRNVSRILNGRSRKSLTGIKNETTQ